MSEPNQLLLAFYGDDFTGSTDALEFLSRAGAKTVLFIEPPTPQQLLHFPDLTAIGVAGMTRSMVPEDMERELRLAFSALHKLGAAHIHYKVCSTFDSSPTVGSIGTAIDIGAEIFASKFIPLLVAAPVLGRHCVFGNLFARMGIGSNGIIHRLDRHPSMSRHPTTPANESDLRQHLGLQTAKKIELIDILQIALPEAETREVLEATILKGAEVILFDALYQKQMEGIGKLIDAYAHPGKPLFSVGSSGIEMALGDHWQTQGLLKPGRIWETPGKAAPLLVASGSCSPVTSAQITWALSRGFVELALNVEKIIAEADNSSVVDSYATTAISLINQGHNVIVHTYCKVNDTSPEKGNKIQKETRHQANSQTPPTGLLGVVLGKVVRAVAEKTRLMRIVIAGGDTSSFAARAMGIKAVEMIAPLSPGAPLCRAFAPGSPIDGLEVNFKGGQVGREDYFGMVLQGKQIV